MRRALAAVWAQGLFGTIYVAPGTYRGVNNANLSVAIPALTIVGSGAVVFDGNSSVGWTVSSLGVQVTGLSFTGFISAILVSGGTSNFTNCTFNGNSASGASCPVVFLR
jgi:hypothetical protein